MIETGNREFLFDFFDLFPLPVEIFAPDGTAVFLNRASLELNNIRDPGLVVGKYNLLADPVCNDQMGIGKKIQMAFNGELSIARDVVVPIQDLVERGVVKEKPFEKSLMDLYLYPVKDNGRLVFVVFVSIVRKIYFGNPDIIRVEEYIDSHWQNDFDPASVAKSINMSERQMYKLFKHDTGMTPGEYYRNCIVEHLKEKLADKNLNIKQAFLACGEDSRGRIARTFKEVTGMSPREYRKSIK